jgi:hypothetical protein
MRGPIGTASRCGSCSPMRRGTRSRRPGRSNA